MKVKNLVGQRFKERPADCVIDSHAFMVRGGYMKNVGNGIFSEFPALKRGFRQRLAYFVKKLFFYYAV